MYSNSVSSNNSIVEQFDLNKQNLSNLKRDISALPAAAFKLAQTAREMKAHVMVTTGDSRTPVYAANGKSIQSKELVKLLKDSKDTLKSFASKAQSLDQEVSFFSNHQEGLFHGNVASIPLAHKVNWCTGQVEKILKRASRLGADQAPKVTAAVNNLRIAAQYTRQDVQSDLDEKVVALDRRIH